uniref:Disease resistance N-terminal domain-containing protein n=1 Tax=Populus trichocarpa TaxID=3694 RepID=A0A2K1YAU9_POPTR
MADELVSTLVNTILGNLNTLALEELGVAAELQNLESTLTTVQAVRQDAEQKQWKSEAVKNWLRKLKDAAYDADDVLDEFAIEDQIRRRQQKDLKKQVRSFFSLSQNPIVFRLQMVRKLNLREKLDAIASEKNKFHLRAGVMSIEAEIALIGD